MTDADLLPALKFVTYVTIAYILMGLVLRLFLHYNKPKKFSCYEIHTVQARMYGCDKQCEECKLEEKTKKQ